MFKKQLPVCLEMDFQVIRARECSFTLLAAILLISCIIWQFEKGWLLQII